MNNFTFSQKITRWRFYKNYKKHLHDNFNNKSVTIGSGAVLNVDVYDVLDNKQIGSLVKSITRLNKRKFKIDLRYRKSKFKAVNYIKPQFDYRSIATFATITPLGDDLISKVEVGWTQINNDEAVFEYSFQLTRPIKSLDQYIDGILSHWNELMRVGCLPFYQSMEQITSHHDFDDEHIKTMFLTIFQGFINKNLYTNLGHNHQLPVNILQISKTSRQISELLKDKRLYAHIYKKTVNKKVEYIIHNPIDKWVINTVVIGSRYSSHGLLQYFSNFGMDYYYFVFGEIEVRELSAKLMRYLNSGKTKMTLKNRKWLFRKFRRVSEVKLYERGGWEDSNIIGVSKDVKDIKYGGRNLAKAFRDVYEDNLKYTNSVFNLTDVHIMVWIVLIISVMSLIATILQLVVRN